MDLERLQFRAHILQKIRSFFLANTSYLELDTPALSTSLIPESCLEIFKTEYIAPFSNKITPLYLVPSPEIYIKKIISQHKINCFQLSKCYRNIESCGHLHSPEFTMLEYYTMNADYKDSIAITEQLFQEILPKKVHTKNNTSTNKDHFSDLRPPFQRISIDDAFKKYAGGRISAWFRTSDTESQNISPVTKAALQAKKLGIVEPKDNPFTTWTLEALYNVIFVQFVEPFLPTDHPVILMDYPAFVSCLAKQRTTSTGFATSDRWELYCRGMELANCYSEETDPQKIQEYYKKESPLKAQNIVPHTIDNNYYKIFDNFPDCSGVAMGVDRFIALLANCKSIDSILPFPLLP